MRSLSVVAVLLSLCVTSAATAATVSTYDALQLSFDERGTIDAVRLEGTALPVLGAGGFYVAEVTAAQTPLPNDGATLPGEAMVGTVTQTAPDEVTVNATSTALGVKLTGVVTGGAALRVNVHLENTRGKDRAFVVYFRVPIDAVGGAWSGALGSSKPLGPDTRAYESFRWFEAFRTTTSVTPLATVVNADQTAALALAVPPTAPSIYRITYQAPYGLQVEWEVGTAPEPLRFPNAANVEALLYRVDPHWPFRAALKRLYLLHPKLWTKRAQDGAWVYDDDVLGTDPHPEDFAVRFAETYLWASDYTRAHGIYALKYTEPWADHLEVSPDGLREWAKDSSSNQGWAQMSKGQPREVAAQAALLSGVFGRDGQYAGYSDPARFTDPEGTHRYVLNPDRELPNFLGFTAAATDVGEVLNRGRSVEEYELFREWGRAPGPDDRYDGLYFDSTNSAGNGWTGWHLFNFRRDHFATTRAPLVFDPQSGKVTLSQALSSVESIRYLSDLTHERGGLVMANGDVDPFVFATAAFCDFVAPGEQYDGSLEDLRAIRAASGTKPTAFIFNSSVTDAEFAHALVYAVFPGGAGVEANRAVYRRWAPLMLEVAGAGWEPLTFARTSDPGVLVERYGRLDRGTLRFVVHRESGSGAAVLRIEKAPLGIRPGVTVASSARVAGGEIALQDRGDVFEATVDLEKEESEVVVLEVTSGEAAPTEGDALPAAPEDPPARGQHPPLHGGDGAVLPGGEPGANEEPGGAVDRPASSGCGGCAQSGGPFGLLGAVAFAAFGLRRRARRISTAQTFDSQS